MIERCQGHSFYLFGNSRAGKRVQKYRNFKLLKGKCPCSIIPYERSDGEGKEMNEIGEKKRRRKPLENEFKWR